MRMKYRNKIPDHRIQIHGRSNLMLYISLGPNKPPIQWVPGAPSLGKWPEREAEVKEWVELYIHFNTPSWRGAKLKHRNNFNFNFTFTFTFTFFPSILGSRFYLQRYQTRYDIFKYIFQDAVMNLWEVQQNAVFMWHYYLLRCIQKFPDWQPGARTANGTTFCH